MSFLKYLSFLYHVGQGGGGERMRAAAVAKEVRRTHGCSL